MRLAPWITKATDILGKRNSCCFPQQLLPFLSCQLHRLLLVCHFIPETQIDKNYETETKLLQQFIDKKIQS